MKIDKNLGSNLTILWLFLVGLLAIYRGLNGTPGQMELNAWGDFFAGTFAPLAFLWLLVGQYEQGVEMQRQAERLEKSLEAQSQLARTAAAQLEHEKQKHADSLRPHMIYTLLEEPRFQVRIQNVGASAVNLEVWLNRHAVRATATYRAPVLANLEILEFDIDVNPYPELTEFMVVYGDTNRASYTVIAHINLGGLSGPNLSTEATIVREYQ